MFVCFFFLVKMLSVRLEKIFPIGTKEYVEATVYFLKIKYIRQIERMQKKIYRTLLKRKGILFKGILFIGVSTFDP